MKKNWFRSLLLMAIVVLPLTSCEKNEEPQKESVVEGQHDPKSDDDQVAVAAYNSLSWLQGSIVVVNNSGEVIRRVYGKPLDASQPDVISVPVVDYASAVKMFHGWVAPGKDNELVEVEGGYDYYLTDEEGKPQGSVSFRAIEDDARVVGRMTVAEGTDLKQVSEVEFVDYAHWPENDDFQVVEAGNIYKMEDYVLTWDDFKAELDSLDFYCIQGNTDGKEGVLVWISPDANDYIYHPRANYYALYAFDYLPTVSAARKVLDFYDNNSVFWANMLQEMDAKELMWSPQEWENATQSSEFLLQELLPYIWPARGIACLDLDDPKGKISCSSTTAYNMYRYMHIKIIPAVVEQ